MTNINKLVVASSLSFCALALAAVSIGFSAWTYSGSANDERVTIGGTVGDNWTYEQDGAFYKMNADGSVNWNEQVTPAVFNTKESGGKYYVSSADNPSGTNVCVYLPTTTGADNGSHVYDGIDLVVSGSNYVYSLANPTNVIQVYYPLSYSSFGDAAFYSVDGSNLKEIHAYTPTIGGASEATSFSVGVTSFFGLDDLSLIDLPATLTSISEYAFGTYSTTYADLTISYGSSIFDWIHNVTLSSSWHYGRSLTVSCTDGDIVYASDSDFEYSVIYNTFASTIQDYTFAGTLDSYGYYPGNDNVLSVTIPENVTSIGTGAFRTDYSKTTTFPITYQGSVKNWVTLTKNAGDDWKKGRILSVDTTEATISFPTQTYLTYSVAFKDTATKIEDETFINETNLTGVTFASNIASIGKKSFYGCNNSSFTTARFNTITVGFIIDEYAFYDCTSLNKIYVPKNATSIGAYSFAFSVNPGKSGKLSVYYAGRKNTFTNSVAKANYAKNRSVSITANYTM